MKKTLPLLILTALPVHAITDEHLAARAEASAAKASADKVDAAKTGKAKKQPYKIVIITDEDAADQAQKFKEYLIKKPPYNKMSAEDLDIKIVKETKANMNCKNDNPDSPRIIGCNNSKLNEIKAKEEAHLAMAFTSGASGGSGGDIPIASLDYPIQTMLHETLHTYGMDDEYCYSESEAKVYCEPPSKQANSAHFQDKPPYKSDSEARVTHGSDVSWMWFIPSATLITQGSALGSKEPATVVAGKQEIGLYRGGTCDKAKVVAPAPAVKSWRPYPNSIMRDYEDDTIYPIYEDIIVKNIEAKIGRTLDYKVERMIPVDKLKNENCPSTTPGSEKLRDLEKVFDKLKT